MEESEGSRLTRTSNGSSITGLTAAQITDWAMNLAAAVGGGEICGLLQSPTEPQPFVLYRSFTLLLDLICRFANVTKAPLHYISSRLAFTIVQCLQTVVFNFSPFILCIMYRESAVIVNKFDLQFSAEVSVLKSVKSKKFAWQNVCLYVPVVAVV